CQAHCPRGATPRSAAPTDCTPSSSRAPPTPRRAAPTGAAGSTASGPRRSTTPSAGSMTGGSRAPSARSRRRRISCVGIRRRCRVELPDGAARGYVCENFGSPLRLPDLGPIGSNGLANPRDYATPVSWYEDREGAFELVAKFAGHLWSARIDHSPLDVVAWHGNHAPYRYDLRRFNTMGSVSYDHPD